ncbi:hypothetical protein BGX38DRAFT_1163465 [Terfezia claveryi]|nr:hypothetical protein BGX38DRAFT_1163465 [Terfezia claveryi]
MRHPVQKLYYCARNKFLYAGIAGTIQVFDTASESLLRQWEAPEIPSVLGKKQNQQQQKEETHSASTGERGGSNSNGAVEVEVATGDEEGVAIKKRKMNTITSSPRVTPATVPVIEGRSTPEPAPKRKKVNFREAPGMGGCSSQKRLNLVTNMVGTSSGRHLVVATNEDKTVRVFRVSGLMKGRDMWLEAGRKEEDVEGGLKLLSERQMPKRLCSLQLLENKQSMTEEEETVADGVVIICGDKFGDVYSLPLIHNLEDSEIPTPAPATESVQNGSSATPEPERKAPRDTGIITTARNKRAARKATEMKSRNSIANLQAKELQFKHKLLLGHISLLLDVVPVTIQVELPDGERKWRTWILSADKDEHIRVSRYPHSYVIEGFCLGHDSYVAKLLVPSFDQQTLISGGGDDYLLRWDWKAKKVLQKLDLKENVANVLEIVKNNKEKIKETNINGGAMDLDFEDEFQTSVTGLWEFKDEVHNRNQVLVSVEGLPALFVFTQNVTGTFEYTTTAGVQGNVLDVAVIGNRILVSIDSQSTPYRLPILGEARELIDCLQPEEDHKHFGRTDHEKVVTTINSKASWGITAEQKEKLNDFFYGAKHLRKFESEERGGD